MKRRAAAVLNRARELAHREDVERLDRLVALNHATMARMLAEVEREKPGGDFVVVLRADKGTPGIHVYRREVVLGELEDRPLELEAMSQPAAGGSFQALVGTANVMQVRTLARPSERPTTTKAEVI